MPRSTLIDKLRSKKRELAKDDCLWILRMLSLDLFRNRIVKVLLINSSVAVTVSLAIQTYLFLQKFDGQYFTNYVAMYALSFYILLCVITLPILTEAIASSLQATEAWDVDSAEPKIRNRIKMESLYLNIFIVFNTVLAQCCGILFMIPQNDDKDIIFIFAIFEKYLPEWKDCLSWLCRIFFLFTSWIMAAPTNQTIYCVSHCKFQVYLLLHYLKNLNCNYEAVDGNQLVYNEDYHNDVKKRLKFCIERHRDLYMIGLRITARLGFLIFLFSIFGAILGMSITWFCFSYSGFNQLTYMRMGTLIIAAGFNFCHLIASCQQTENVTSELFEILKQTEWYYWNKENTKIYLIFLLNATRHYRVEFTGGVAINYELGVSIAKKIYSAASVMSQL